MSLFTEVDRLKEELDALRPLSPEQEARILQKFRLDWNYNSNAIEGNSLTLGETRSLLLHGLTAAGKPIRDHLDIKGHNEAVVWLEEVVRNEQTLTGHFIREMHQLLLGEPYEVRAQTPDGRSTSKTIHPGQYKTTPNNVLTATGEMFYFASPEETPAKMTDLVDWYRQETEHPTLHPVALAAEFHYRFVRIHPFDDGNGRMSRLLMNLILMRGGYPMTVIKAIDRNRYLSALAEADAGDTELFFKFIIENVSSSIRLMIRAAKGESIDEPDDLDKKLAILKTQLLNIKDKVEALWNKDTAKIFYESIFNPWVIQLTDMTSKFNFAFVQNNFGADIYYGKEYEPDHIKQSSNAGDVINDTIQKAASTSINPTAISFYIRWEGFIQPLNSFDMNLVIDFYFNKSELLVYYEINDKSEDDFKDTQPSDESFIMAYNYKSIYPDEDIKAINSYIANKLYEFLSSKVEVD